MPGLAWSACSNTPRGSAAADGSGCITRRPRGRRAGPAKRHFGDPTRPELDKRYSPTAVLCGHIHEALFKNGGAWIDRIGDTWLFNTGGQIGDIPARVENDFAQQTAAWISPA